MTPYIEIHIILGVTYGIEDYEDGRPLSQHFFGNDYLIKGGCKRFRLWRGGCTFRQVNTLAEARRELIEYTTQHVCRARDKATQELVNCTKADAQLSEMRKLQSTEKA